jgi:hypothetical protein
VRWECAAQIQAEEARRERRQEARRRQRAARLAALHGRGEEEKRPGGEPNGRLNDAPCSPFTGHGASIKRPCGAGEGQKRRFDPQDRRRRPPSPGTLFLQAQEFKAQAGRTARQGVKVRAMIVNHGGVQMRRRRPQRTDTLRAQMPAGGGGGGGRSTALVMRRVP